MSSFYFAVFKGVTFDPEVQMKSCPEELALLCGPMCLQRLVPPVLTTITSRLISSLATLRPSLVHPEDQAARQSQGLTANQHTNRWTGRYGHQVHDSSGFSGPL